MKTFGKYTVGLTYKVSTDLENGTYVVTKIEPRKSGTTFIHFKGLTGCLSPYNQTFMIGSWFDTGSQKI